MSDVATSDALLVDCLLDLKDGERRFARRMPGIASRVADGALGETLGEAGRTAERMVEELEALIDALGEAEPDADNIWMQGILDDARRDTEMVERGPLLDTALIGAIRKAIVAALVSYETAILAALACRRTDQAAALAARRGQLQEHDGRLAALLARIALSLD